jgi:catechol 2,3-dioxygenase-like lactoylglutathione lyase family enzyme
LTSSELEVPEIARQVKGSKMTQAFVEHANITVSDPDATAKWLCEVFGWTVRWKGASLYNGKSVHVGGEASYIALYSMGHGLAIRDSESYHRHGGLNHIGIVVADLAAIEKKVHAAGFESHSHANYEPGRRFYFHDQDGIEFEVICYH